MEEVRRNALVWLETTRPSHEAQTPLHSLAAGDRP